MNTVERPYSGKERNSKKTSRGIADKEARTKKFREGQKPTEAITYLQDYQAPAYEIEKTDLVFNVRNQTRIEVRSTLAVKRNRTPFEREHLFPKEFVDATAELGRPIEDPLPLEEAFPELQLDCGNGIEIHKVKINGQTIKYRREKDKLIIQPTCNEFRLEIESVINPTKNTELSGLYTSGADPETQLTTQLITQCEPLGYRNIVPSLDRPDAMSRYQTTIIADKADYPVIMSNGNPQEKRGEKKTRPRNSKRHSATFENPFKQPSYLFALVAGKFEALEDTFTTAGGRPVKLKIYTTPQNKAKCHHAMNSLKKAMKWDEEENGRECDLDEYKIVVADDFNFGAMENKGLNIFNSKYVLYDDATATDEDAHAIEAVIGHEYFHNYRGNRVTLRSFFDITLKEGFTVFADQEFSAAMGSPVIERIKNVKNLRTRQFAEDGSLNAKPIRPIAIKSVENCYSATSYDKGAEVVRMLETLLGKEKFRKASDLYFQKHDGQAVTTKEFIAAMQETVPGLDLSQFEESWYLQSGTPAYRVETQYNETEDGKTFELTIEQTDDNEKPYYFPLNMGLLDQEGNEIPLELANVSYEEPTKSSTGIGKTSGDIPSSEWQHDLKRGILHVNKRKQTFVFKVPSQPVPSLLRNFSAPIKLDIAGQSENDLKVLMAHDTDGFNRYEATQKLAMISLNNLIENHQNGERLVVDNDILDIYGLILEDSEKDPALVAEMLSLPSTAQLVQGMKVYDHEAADKARAFLTKAIAKRHQEKLLAFYTQFHTPGEYKRDKEAAGQRKLKNICLEYLMSLGDKHLELASLQFDTALNMTDEYAALRILCDSSNIQKRDEAIVRFYDKYKTNPLVFNKWLTAQAQSDRADILNRLVELSDLPEFKKDNPNNNYALYNTFGQNYEHFHLPSGEGYKFLADKVIEIDAYNPTVASRLAANFKDFPKLKPEKQALMRAEIERISNQPGLSPNVAEIIRPLMESN